MAYVVAPELFVTRHMRVEVVTGDHICVGQTVCDVFGYSTKPNNVHVATEMDVPKFWDLMAAAWQCAGEASPLK